MYKLMCGCYLLLLCVSASLAQCKITVSTDHNDAIYHINEIVHFSVSVADNNGPVKTGSISYKLTRDLGKVISTGKISLTGHKVTIDGKLDAPGFLNCQIDFEHNGQTLMTQGGAGIDPLNIKPFVPAPADFDKFWSDQRDRLRKYPAAPFLRPIASDDPNIDAFELRIDCLNCMPVAGYFARPSKAPPQSLPAILHLHGAGMFSASIDNVVNSAKKGMIALEINAHGIANGQPTEFYTELFDISGGWSGYPYKGRESRDTCYFLGMYLRLIRAMDFLTSQPQWDKQILITKGFSQGGGQAIVAAGLDPRVTAVAASAPAMCSHNGEIVGWPSFVPTLPDGKPDAKIAEVAGYFDTVNFAARTNARVLLSVGFVDTICKPTTVYAAYNSFKGRKEIINLPLAIHSSPEQVEHSFWKMIDDHINEMRQ